MCLFRVNSKTNTIETSDGCSRNLQAEWPSFPSGNWPSQVYGHHCELSLVIYVHNCCVLIVVLDFTVLKFCVVSECVPLWTVDGSRVPWNWVFDIAAISFSFWQDWPTERPLLIILPFLQVRNVSRSINTHRWKMKFNPVLLQGVFTLHNVFHWIYSRYSCSATLKVCATGLGNCRPHCPLAYILGPIWHQTAAQYWPPYCWP